MKMSIKEISPKVYLLTFDTQYELCMTFVRIQEFYESPEFRNKYFELEEYMDWWAKNYGNGSFDYPSRWSGFNVPGHIICKWIEKVERNNGVFRDKERKLLDRILSRTDKTTAPCFDFDAEYDSLRDVYVIAVHREDGGVSEQDISHELAHAFYTLHSDYRESCNSLLEEIPVEVGSGAMTRLLRMGYAKEVLKDELQAYFSTTEGRKKKLKDLWKRKEFADNFQTFRKSLKKKKGK